MINLPGLSIERVVTVLTPFFAAGAAVMTGFLSQHTGVKIDASALEGIEIAAFLGTVGIVAKWLHGRQIPEVAQIGLTPAVLDQLHREIEVYLHQTAGATKVDVDAIVEQVVARITSGLTRIPPGGTLSTGQGSAPPSA